jgi:murein DD-endopeptidase MepM/ murein hydrolase activator NlpD
MNVIVVAKFLKSPKKISFEEPKMIAIAAAALLALLALGFGLGVLARSIGGPGAELADMRADLVRQQKELAQAKEEAQRDVNAIAARVGELQAQANRLNALGERLTRSGKLEDGEFDFNKTPGVGGDEAVKDIAAGELLASLNAVQAQFDESGRQLSVLESMIFDQKLQASSLPSGMPAKGYITSGFGYRNDPFRGGSAHHKGIDFDANIGDPVFAAADGVVSFAGVKGGYGNVIEVDHGNGYVTLYAHNSAFTARVGDLVRRGQQIAKAGNTGRSTGAHLHFEVHENGVPVNPRPFLDARDQGVAAVVNGKP